MLAKVSIILRQNFYHDFLLMIFNFSVFAGSHTCDPLFHSLYPVCVTFKVYVLKEHNIQIKQQNDWNSPTVVQVVSRLKEPVQLLFYFIFSFPFVWFQEGDYWTGKCWFIQSGDSAQACWFNTRVEIHLIKLRKCRGGCHWKVAFRSINSYYH